MGEKQVSVVTDGSVALRADTIDKYKIVVLTRRVRIGRQILTSDRQTTLETINKRAANSRGPVSLLPLQLQQFVSVYRKLNSRDRSIVSIHAPDTIDSACYQAHLARSMLLPDIELDIFEAGTLDAGISFLVEVAARFARQRGTTRRQVQALLQRLQDKIHTLLITTKPQHLPCYPPLDAQQRLRAAILGAQTLLSLEKGKRMFEVKRQSPGLIRELGNQRKLLPQIDGPCDILIKYCGYKRHLKGLQPQLMRLFRAENFQLEQAGVEASFLPRDFIEIVFLPTATEVSRIEQWVKKWG